MSCDHSCALPTCHPLSPTLITLVLHRDCQPTEQRFHFKQTTWLFHIFFLNYTGNLIKTKLLQKHARYTYIGTQTCGRNKIYVYKGIKETWEVYTAKDRKQKCVLTGFLHWLECILLMPEQGVLLSFKRLAGSWSIREHATESFTRFRVIFEKQQNIFLISLTYLW